MTKQELAESMAEFLGMKALPESDWAKPRKEPLYIVGDNYLTAIKHFFSPDGFFAVWDEVPAKYHVLFFSMGGGFKCIIGEFEGDGPDQYTAFYKAVHKMRMGK